MCDTIIAPGGHTEDGVTIFGKNSDREPNEAQYIVQIPEKEYPAGSDVQCTYIRIPQVPKTHAVLLCKPFWMWGAEMGTNEYGLTIGNEAVFTKVPYTKGPALTGMDLIRLALERSKTARKAIELITGLIRQYGQGGNCGYQNKLFYHNSFILADPQEAWLLETAGEHWAAKKLTEVYAISNRLTIEDQWDLASDNLVAFAVQQKWCSSEADFSFARCYSDFLFTELSSSRDRRQRALQLLQAKAGRIQVSDVASILRDHGPAPEASWRPDKGIVKSTICNHAGFGPIRISQTTGSLISHLTPKNSTHFVTGTAAPCTGIFKPIWVDTIPPGNENSPSPEDNQDNKNSLFWKHELLHRKTLENFHSNLAEYKTERDQLEQIFFSEAISHSEQSAEQRLEFVNSCFLQSAKKEKEWMASLQQKALSKSCGWLYSLTWKKHNRRADLSLP